MKSKWYAHTTMDTLAKFIAAYKPISDLLAAAGWVKTADSGQVDWATVTLPGAGGSVYEIWRMGDALQASSPCFIRLSYLRGASANALRVSLVVGTATDGAGTITGNAIVYGANQDINATAGFYTHYASAASNRLQIALRADTDAYNPFVCSVERRKDSSGADADDFIARTVLGPSGSNVGLSLAGKHGGAWGLTTVGIVPTAWCSVKTVIASGMPLVVPCFPIWGKVDNPLIGMVFSGSNSGGNPDITPPQIIRYKLYGVWRDYVTTVFPSSGGLANTDALAPAILWE